jgi:UDP-N-acetylmuramoyl-tripeptide--D-alanyl-D-alanine ligase
MLGLSIAEAAQALGARSAVADPRSLRGVTTDSRAVQEGDLFVALPGARVDGHDFIPAVHLRGAAAVLAQPGRGPRPQGLAVIEVPDTTAALAALARHHLSRLKARVYGITGSVGKTTAKDFLSQLLGGQEMRVHAAPASFNSEIGLPLSILGAELNCRALVLEYGVNAPGEMEVLRGIARPDEVWITALAEVHLEGMGNLATVRREKALLAAAAPAEGKIWLTDGVRAQLREFPAGWQAPILPLTALSTPGLRVLSRAPMAWELTHPRWGSLRLPVVAEHEVATALSAAEIAAASGVTAEEIVSRLSRLQRPRGRLSVQRFGALTVLNDAYNASPTSLQAALQALAAWPGRGRRIAVLGAMNELGAQAESLHRAAGADAAGLPLTHMIGVGQGGAWIAEGAQAHGMETLQVPDQAAALERLAADLRPDDVILLKASRSEGLDRLLEPLERAAARGLAAVPAAGRS